jgi:hypothetical protein
MQIVLALKCLPPWRGPTRHLHSKRSPPGSSSICNCPKRSGKGDRQSQSQPEKRSGGPLQTGAHCQISLSQDEKDLLIDACFDLPPCSTFDESNEIGNKKEMVRVRLNYGFQTTVACVPLGTHQTIDVPP